MQKYKLAISFVFTHWTVQQNHINCGRIKSKDIMQKDFLMFLFSFKHRTDAEQRDKTQPQDITPFVTSIVKIKETKTVLNHKDI